MLYYEALIEREGEACMTGKATPDRNESLIFFPDFSSWRDRADAKLSPRELEGTTLNERELLKTIVSLYRTGAIIAIEDYSQGCSYPKDRIRQILEKHQPKVGSGKRESETFVFSCYGASHDSDKFMADYKIARQPSGNGLEQIAEYIKSTADNIPESNAFFEKESGGGIKFGFTLGNQAAKALHKINLSMNPVCRGAGD